MRAFNQVSLLPWLLSLCALVAAHSVAGEEAEPQLSPAQSPAQQQAQAAWQAASDAMIHGPSTIELRDQAQLELPYGYGFVPQQQAAALMRTMGNLTGDDFIGLVFPEADSAPWFVSIQFEDSGYVKDDDAKNWNADELLQSLKDGTEAGNEERAQMGIPALKVTRWVEEPKYETRDHRLVWSAEAMLKDIEDPDPTINYNTYALGRDGYISLNLVTSSSTVDADKFSAQELLAAVTYKDGKRYSDFDASTDKVAAYGLAALVSGVAAKKLGLLAMAGAFILKFAKVFALAAAAIGGSLWSRIRGRGRKDSGTPV